MARRPGTRHPEVSSPGSESQKKHDYEEVVPSPLPGRETTEEPDPQHARPHSAGRKDELRSSENAVDHQVDGTEGYSDVPNAADGADHEGIDGDFTGSAARSHRLFLMDRLGLRADRA